jgi:outer membrane protein insertion porin family
MTPSVRPLAILLAAAALAAPPRASAVPVADIVVENRGGGTIDESLVRTYLRAAVGSEFDRAVVSQDVRALEKTGRFSSVESEARRTAGGVVLVYGVRLKPRVARLEIRGADAVGNRKVREWLAIGVGDLADEANLGAAARRIRDEYLKRYYPDTEVRWTITPDPSSGAADLVVTVREGPRARVREVEFAGNEHLSSETLRAAMRQRRFVWYNPLHWFSGAGRLSAEELEGDVYALRRAYLDVGRLDVKIGEPEIRRIDERALAIRIPIEEGPEYRLAAVTLEGATRFETNVLWKVMTVRAGRVASLGQIESTASALSSYYQDRGYLRTEVTRDVDPDAQEGFVRVAFRIREGVLSRVRDVRVRGNTITRDKVIRRELAVFPGDQFNRSKVRASENRLRNLGYFKYVGGVMEPAPEPDRTDIVFEVEEQRMGSAGVGASFSDIDSLSGYFEISHGNFDLTRWPPVGGGQKVRLRGTIGTERTDAVLSFVEPWFLDRRLALGVNLYRSEKRYLSSEFDQREMGGEVSLTRPIGRHERLKLAYELEEVDIFNVSDGASDRIKAEEGARTKSEARVSIEHDTRDRAFVPTSGNHSSLILGLAGGPLGAETDLYRFDLNTTEYVPLWWRHVLMLRGRGALVNEYGDSDSVPLFERYFLGGANTVRGFEYREVGPVDENEEPLGGRTLAFGSVEYIVPIVKNFRAATFYDAGMVWEKALEFDNGINSSWGVGVRIDLPMLPIRLDYSWPIETDPHNDTSGGRFSFWMGYGY